MSTVSRYLRTYPTLLRIGLAEAVAYRAEFVVWMLATTMPLVMLAIMSAIAREGPIGGMDERAFVAYYLVKTSDGTASISVFEDQAGTDESTRLAAAFVKENVASVAGDPPEVLEGETVIHFAR